MIGIALFFFAFRFRDVLWSPGKKIKLPLEDVPTVLIAGTPKSGKSSFFQHFAKNPNKFSIAGDTGQFVVTTLSGNSIQLIDIPKCIQRKGIEFLKPWIDLVIFLFDVSPNSFPIETQMNMMRSLEKKLPGVSVLPVINIKDEINEDKVNELERKLSKDIPRISVKNGEMGVINNFLLGQFF
jgi:GTP1/Obg family GTP-binding protein